MYKAQRKAQVPSSNSTRRRTLVFDSTRDYTGVERSFPLVMYMLLVAPAGCTTMLLVAPAGCTTMLLVVRLCCSSCV